MTTSIIVAVISTLGIVLAALIQTLRKENKSDHSVVIETLKIVHEDVVRVEKKLDTHLDDHKATVSKKVRKTS